SAARADGLVVEAHHQVLHEGLVGGLSLGCGLLRLDVEDAGVVVVDGTDALRAQAQQPHDALLNGGLYPGRSLGVHASAVRQVGRAAYDVPLERLVLGPYLTADAVGADLRSVHAELSLDDSLLRAD